MGNSCQECRDRLHPDNPTAGRWIRGRWLAPLCHSCPEYVEPPEESEALVPYKDIRSDRLGGVDLRGEVAALKGKVNFLMREREGKRMIKKGKAKGSIPL